MRASVFAVEDHAAQVCWDGLPIGEVTWCAADVERTVVTDGGPGAVTLSGLPEATRLELTWAGATGRRRVGHFSTLPSPPGRLLCRFATVNDIHLGATSFGTLRPFWGDGRGEPHALVCARAAASAAREWGAQLLVGKGDLTQDGTPQQWDTVGQFFADCGLPTFVVEGNHDICVRAVDGRAILAEHGLALHQQPAFVDLAGVRVIGLPTTRWHVEYGTIAPEHLQAAAQMVADAPGAAVVAMHHYPQRFRWPTLYPSGIPGPVASVLLDTLAEANSATLVLSGHSHRHRSHRHGPLVVAEVGSTKDYPGSWAGYAVHEGGIRQVTMRVAEPAAIAWTERGRRVLGGLWGMWAPGLRSHRCFTWAWPAR